MTDLYEALRAAMTPDGRVRGDTPATDAALAVFGLDIHAPLTESSNELVQRWCIEMRAVYSPMADLAAARLHRSRAFQAVYCFNWEQDRGVVWVHGSPSHDRVVQAFSSVPRMRDPHVDTLISFVLGIGLQVAEPLRTRLFISGLTQCVELSLLESMMVSERVITALEKL